MNLNEQRSPRKSVDYIGNGEGYQLLCSVAKVQNKILSNVIHSSNSHHKLSATDWDESHDILIKSWRKQASINIWLQQASSYYYARLSDWTTYPCIVSSVLTAISVFSIEHEAVKYVVAGLSLVSSVLLAVNKHSRAAEKSQQYSSTARDYASFIRYLNFISILTGVQKPPMKETIAKVRSDFDKINENQLDPPLYIIRAYERNHKSIEASMYADLVAERRNPELIQSSRESSLDNV